MAGPAANAGAVSVLLAEPEDDVAEMSARYLRADGLQVRLVATPETALTELTYGPDAAAVLDLTMPGLDPRRIRRALRTPVIFLVSGPRTRGLARGGARRWLSRPFSPRQLVGMVRDVLTLPEHAPSRPADRSAGGLRLDGPRRPGITGGERGRPAATGFAILAAMMAHSGRFLARRSLLAAAGREAAGDQSADVYIAQLRAKVASAAVLRTVRGAGYALDPVQGGQ